MDKIEQVEKEVLKHFPIAAAAPSMLGDKTRKAEYKEPRHIIWFIAADVFGIRSVRLGERYKRKHSTVLKAIQKTYDLLEVDKEYKKIIDQITLELI